MKKRNLMKKVIAFGMSMMISVGCVSNAYATDTLNYDPDAGEVVTAEEMELIDEKIAQMSTLGLKKQMLGEQIKYVVAKSYNRAPEVSEEIALIDDEIEKVRQELYGLGASKPSEEMLQKLVGNESTMAFSNARTVHPSEYVPLLEDEYEVWAYSVYGTDNRQQYHIVLSYKNNEAIRPVGTVAFFGEYDTNGDWGERFLNMSVDVVVSTLLDEIPIVSVVPWESLFETPPSAQVLSCQGKNAMAGKYGLSCNIKFVAVCDDAGYWRFVLTTNRILANYDISTMVWVKIGSTNYGNWRSSDVLVVVDEEIAGRFHYSIKDATDAFAESTYKNTCFTEWIWRYKVKENGTVFTKDILCVSILAPNSIFDLVAQ